MCLSHCQTTLFGKAFVAQRQILLVASKAKEPDKSTLLTLFKPLQEASQPLDRLREANRKSAEENHITMLNDATSTFGWVGVRPKPDEYFAELLGGAQMYGNRVRMANKDKDQAQVDWIIAFNKLCSSFRTYIKDHHSRGLCWKLGGMPADQALREVRSAKPPPSSSAASATAVNGAPAPPPMPAGGGPPPPPPLPPQIDTNQLNQHQSQPSPQQSGDMNAVFADLNRGESVTSNLRKVSKSEMTHKNPSLRTQAPQAPTRSDSTGSGRGKSPAPKKKPDSMRAKKPPVKALEGNKWAVEHFESEMSPVEVHAEKQHSILISCCKSATVRVSGKANAITVDSCQRLDLVVDSLVSAVEIVNSRNFRMQVLGTVPAVQLDKVDGAVVFLSRESLAAEVFTSKCSEVNVTLPPEREEDDSVECPVPEQIKSYVVDGKLVSEIVRTEGM